MIESLPPRHMDRWSRNERLYRHLLGLGLVVDPLFSDDAKTLIDCLLVSTETREIDVVQKVPEKPASGGVALPVARPEIGNVVTPTEALGDGVVVEFPPVR